VKSNPDAFSYLLFIRKYLNSWICKKIIDNLLIILLMTPDLITGDPGLWFLKFQALRFPP
jgi:hypothetical protein